IEDTVVLLTITVIHQQRRVWPIFQVTLSIADIMKDDKEGGEMNAQMKRIYLSPAVHIKLAHSIRKLWNAGLLFTAWTKWCIIQLNRFPTDERYVILLPDFLRGMTDTSHMLMPRETDLDQNGRIFNRLLNME